MKTLSDLFPPGQIPDIDDMLCPNGAVDLDRLAYHLLCMVRTIDPYGEQSSAKLYTLLHDYLGAAIKAGRGVLK